MYVQVGQHQVNPLGWPIPLHPDACSTLAFVDNSQELPCQTVAGDSFEVLVETQDCLHQRICQVCCSQSTQDKCHEIDAACLGLLRTLMYPSGNSPCPLLSPLLFAAPCIVLQLPGLCCLPEVLVPQSSQYLLL